MDYTSINKQLSALLEGERDFIINSSQFSAFIFNQIPDINWAGFYLYRDNILKLGPFQGQVACIYIPLSKGVCGKSFTDKKVLRVSDVHEFPGHIACDAKTNSELVLPFSYGVFDIDSETINRFSKEDQVGIELLIQTFLNSTDDYSEHSK
ncbi:MAG: L-methionine (R)-S-oxide reductase [Thermoproteota archaeon]|jgi:L-methionine (R)-S-oxide reductase